MTTVNCVNTDEATGNILVSGSSDTNVKLWDLRMNSSNKCFLTFSQHQGAITSCQLSPDSKWVASGGEDGAMKIWEVGSGKVLANYYFPDQAVTCLEYNPHNLTIANGSTDKTVKYWDLENFSNVT